MGRFIDQIKAIWGRLQTPQKATIVLVLLGLVGIFALVFYGATRPDFTVLASELSRAQATRIAAELDSRGIPYRMVDGETAVLVPSKDRYRLRNDLAEQEILGDDSTGFEILDKNGFGQSTFMERKRFDRAVAGELERGFRELPGVASARVIVVQPPPSPFLDQERAPSASVKLRMDSGRRLTKRQVAGIVRLTAGAVEGLSADRVQVMDDAGLLTDERDDPLAMAASSSLEAEQAVEQHLSRKAQEMLDRVLGPGRSMVRVAVDLDFTKRSAAESNPTTSVLLRQETSGSDEATPVPAPGGVAGTAGNIEPPVGGATDVEEATKSTEQDTREYVVGKKTITREDEIGVIRGMTVSIWLDHKQQTRTETDPDSGEEVTTTARVPYDASEKERFADMVLNAIGYNAARGVQERREPEADASRLFSYSVESLPMYQEPDEAPVPSQASLGTIVDGPWPRYLLAAVVAVVLLLVARGQLKRSHVAWQEERERMRREAEEREQQAANDPSRHAEDMARERMNLRDRVFDRVQKDPKYVAQVMRNWIRDA